MYLAICSSGERRTRPPLVLLAVGTGRPVPVPVPGRPVREMEKVVENVVGSTVEVVETGGRSDAVETVVVGIDVTPVVEAAVVLAAVVLALTLSDEMVVLAAVVDAWVVDEVEFWKGSIR